MYNNNDIIVIIFIDICVALLVVQQRGLTYKQMEVFAASGVFAFPEMLPEYNLYVEDISERKIRPQFLKSEDKLVAWHLYSFILILLFVLFFFHFLLFLFFVFVYF